MTPLGASAPGKALFCGEYAVLEGAPAIIAAVDRRVSVGWAEHSDRIPPEVEATLRCAESKLGPVGRSPTVDVSDLQQDGVKLGLGSSAAAAAATAAAVFASHGWNLDERGTREQVFSCALKGHSSIAARGSGADVAASTFGGLLRFTRSGNDIQVSRSSLPDELSPRLVWTGYAARTSDFLGRVRKLSQDDPGRYRLCMQNLSELSLQFASAFEQGEAARVVAAAARYSAAMGNLGDAAGVPIVDAGLRRVGELARRFSGSSKPCGAGGGDVAIAFFVDAGAADRFVLACRDEGLHPIDVSWGATGVCAP